MKKCFDYRNDSNYTEAKPVTKLLMDIMYPPVYWAGYAVGVAKGIVKGIKSKIRGEH